MRASFSSRSAILVVRRLIAGEAVDAAASGLNPREWRELANTFDIAGSGSPDATTAPEAS